MASNSAKDTLAGDEKRNSTVAEVTPSNAETDAKNSTAPIHDGDHSHMSEGARTRLATTMIMSSFCVAGLLGSMEGVIVSISLPTISRELALTSTEYSWVGSAYLLAAAATMPSYEPISDAIGRKPVFAFGLILFGVGSILAAVASSPSMLIAGRTIQGIGDGAIPVMTNVCMADLFPLESRGLYIAMYAGASCLGAAIAPLIGGALTEYAGWQWCFWINLPVTALALALAVFYLPFPLMKPSSLRALKRIDIRSITLITSGVTILLLGLQFGGISFPWNSKTVLSLLIVGSAVSILFVLQLFWHQPVRPLMPLRLFQTRTGTACLAISFFHGFSYLTISYYMPIYWQIVLGFETIQVGYWTLLTAIPTTIFTISGAIIIERRGKYASVIRIATGFLALGTGLLIDLPPTYRSYPRIVLFQLIAAVGIGPLFQAPLIGLQSSVKKEDAPTAYTVAIFLRTIASVMGLVLGQVILSNTMKQQADDLLAVGISSEVVDAIALDIASLSYLADLGNKEQRDVVRTALTFSLSRVWITCTVLAGIGFLTSCLVKDLDLTQDEGSNEADASSKNT